MHSFCPDTFYFVLFVFFQISLEIMLLLTYLRIWFDQKFLRTKRYPLKRLFVYIRDRYEEFYCTRRPQFRKNSFWVSAKFDERHLRGGGGGGGKF